MINSVDPTPLTSASRLQSLRRIRRPSWIVATVVLVVAALAGSFITGRMLATPTRDTLLEANESIAVTAEVTMRVVDDHPSLAGAVVAGESAVLQPIALPDEPIVTRQALTPGSPVAGGTLLGVIAGSPVFGLPGPLPLYRDLRIGDVGDDVRAFQVALAGAGFDVESTGTLGLGSVAAVRSLYQTADIPIPLEPAPAPTQTPPSDGTAPTAMQPVIPRGAFVSLPVPSATVIDVAGVGSVLSDERPLARILVSGASVTARVDPLSLEAFPVGTSVRVQVDGQQLVGTVGSVGEFQPAAGGLPPGRDLRITVDGAALGAIAAGTPLNVSLAAVVPESLAVPAIAVREDAQGTYLLLPPDDDAAAPTRVAVDIVRLSGGWAAIEAGDLEPGDLVLVS